MPNFNALLAITLFVSIVTKAEDEMAGGLIVARHPHHLWLSNQEMISKNEFGVTIREGIPCW